MRSTNKRCQSGWQKQGIYDEPRLSEIVELYKQIGFEVAVEPTQPEELTGCTDCIRANIHRFKTVYTRNKTKTGFGI